MPIFLEFTSSLKADDRLKPMACTQSLQEQITVTELHTATKYVVKLRKYVHLTAALP